MPGASDGTNGRGGPDPSRKRPVERTRTDDDAGTDPADDASTETAAETSWLERVPKWFVPLGAGCLLAAALLTLGAAGFVGYALSADRLFGYRRWQLYFALAQFLFVTGLLGVGARYARQRRRWLVALLAALGGSFTGIALPLTLPAFVFLGLSRYHFSHRTRAGRIEAGMADGAGDADGNDAPEADAAE